MMMVRVMKRQIRAAVRKQEGPCLSSLPSAHSLGGPNPEAHSQEGRILMSGSVPALETWQEAHRCEENAQGALSYDM